MIIGLIGQKRVGKDTTANIIKSLDGEYKSMALADPIKDIARIMFNFSHDQLYEAEKDQVDSRWNIKPRDFFEQFGTEIMQFDIYKYLPNLQVPERKFWVLSLLSKIKPTDKVIITDVRGQHEIEEIIRFNPDAKFIHISRPSSCNLDTQSHITQQEPNMIDDKYITDKIINDGSIDDLERKIKKIMVNYMS